MKTKTFLITLLTVLVFGEISTFAQDSMYVHKTDASILKIAISEIDSITYTISETSDSSSSSTNTVTDANGNVYKTVVIGSQEWMAENLAYLPDGETFSAKTNGSEDDPFSKHYYIYGFDDGGDMTAVNASVSASNTLDSLGVMYNWYAAIGIDESSITDTTTLNSFLASNTVIQGVCPSGWHLPTNDEFETLLSTIGKDADDGGDPLKASTGWDTNTGTDDYGFSLIPSGRRKSDATQDFENYPSYSYLWTASFIKYETGSTETGCARAYARYIKGADDYFKENTYRSSYGHAVRCVKDSE